MMLKPPTSRVTTLKADECYWSVLDGSVADGLRGKARQRALLFALEQDLPMPIDEIHAVFLARPGGQIIACACPRDLLVQLAEDADVVHPEAIPDWLDCDQDAVDFDLLGGDILSKRVRRMGAMHLVTVLLVCTLLSSLLTVGFVIRSRAFEQERQDARAATNAAQGLVLPPAGAGAQPTSIRLAALLRTVNSHSDTVMNSDFVSATDSLEQILARWPQDVRLQRLTVGKLDIRIDLTMPADLDPSLFIGALEELNDWTLSAPVVRRSQESTSVSLSLQRAERAAG